MPFLLARIFYLRILKFFMDQHMKDVAAFLREHRSNESNFEKIYKRLQEEERQPGTDPDYKAALRDAKDRAEEYQTAKQKGVAYPEFEKFVSEFEKAVTQRLQNE